MVDTAMAVTFGTATLRVNKTYGMPDLAKVIPQAELSRKTAKGDRHWNVPYPDAAKVVAWADSNTLTVDPKVRAYANHAWERELQAMVLSTAPTLPAGETLPKITGLLSTLLPTQEVAVQAASRAWVENPAKNTSGHRALLVADEPGLGKTIVALAALRIHGMECERAVIVCPTSLTANWAAEMDQHFAPGEFRPWIAQSLSPSPVPDDCNAVIIGWEILQAWADTLIAWRPDAVVADEGHYAKSGKQQTRKKEQVVRDDEGRIVRDEHGNLQMEKVTKVVSGSARASAVLNLGATVVKNKGLVLALTGTPIVNRPVELLPLLEFVGILNLFGSKQAFQHRHCGPKKVSIGQGRTSWNFNGASNLMELNTRLAASGHYIRRTKQTLIDAGVMKRKFVDGIYTYDYMTRPNPWIITATPAEMAEYRAAEQETTDFFRDRAREIAGELRAGVDSVKVRAKVAAEGGQSKHLERIAALRKEAAMVKVPYIVAKVQEMIDKGEKVVIAAHHREVVDAYANAFTGLKIQGAMGTKKIEEAKALFNETPVTEHPVLVLSVEAGKTGHTLCKQTIHGVGPACAYMVFAEQVWTPGDEAQAQDRIWRIGQDREARIINALLATSIDVQMFEQRAKKRAVVNAAVDAVDPDLRASADNEKDGRGALVQTLVYGRPAA